MTKMTKRQFARIAARSLIANTSRVWNTILRTMIKVRDAREGAVVDALPRDFYICRPK